MEITSIKSNFISFSSNQTLVALLRELSAPIKHCSITVKFISFSLITKSSSNDEGNSRTLNTPKLNHSTANYTSKSIGKATSPTQISINSNGKPKLNPISSFNSVHNGTINEGTTSKLLVQNMSISTSDSPKTSNGREINFHTDP